MIGFMRNWSDDWDARFGPADNEKAVSRLPAGSEVRILTASGNWIYSLLPDNTRGWIASHELARIRPTAAN
jgi:hypothetical protein